MEIIKEPYKNRYCNDCNNNVCGKCCAEESNDADITLIKECDDFHDWIVE